MQIGVQEANFCNFLLDAAIAWREELVGRAITQVGEFVYDDPDLPAGHPPAEVHQAESVAMWVDQLQLGCTTPIGKNAAYMFSILHNRFQVHNVAFYTALH